MLDVYLYCVLRSAAVIAHHFRMNPALEPLLTKRGGGIYEALPTATEVGRKTLHFLQNTFLSSIENVSFMWVQVCSKKGILIVSSFEKKPSHYLTT